AAAGVRMIRLNMPGFAGSSSVQRAGDWDALVEVVAEAASTLADRPFVLLGHSFGGLVALRAAARSRLCKGLALLAPAGLRAHAAVRKLPPRLALKATNATRVSREVFFRAMARTPIGAHASREDSNTTLALLSTLDYGPSLAAARSLKVPVFCASCLDDRMVEPAIVEELLASLNTRQHLTFERGGHAPQKDHAAEIGAALVQFVNGLG
ncbi:MAG TPA: alpha/beta fold hydrolase, partial [Polyangiales bacterium]|nr:alpha/beta fold hydrolase [Polyangiales bacterium]